MRESQDAMVLANKGATVGASTDASFSISTSASEQIVPMVVLNDVHFAVQAAGGLVNILRGVSLTIPRGQTVSIVGPSGSGKSSLMMLIGGLERPTAGAVHVAGTDYHHLDEDGLALFRRANVGIVFQTFHLIPTMTALENVAIPLELAGDDQAFDRAAAGLSAVGLGHRLAHYPGQLSGGEQQRTAIARAFAPAPPLLLADEPTGNLDGGTGAQIIDLLFDLAQRASTTVMLITHDQGLAQQCARVLNLVDGCITDDRSGAGRVVA